MRMTTNFGGEARPMKRVSLVRLRPAPPSESELAIDRMRDCLDVAFPPAGAAAAPAAFVGTGKKPEPPHAVPTTGAPQGDAGVELTEVSFGSSVPEPDRRSEERSQLSVYRSATLRWQDYEALCLIRNISSGGMMGKLHTDMMPGEPVTVEIRSGTLTPGHVVWSHDNLVGVQFDHRIDVLEVLHAPVSGEADTLLQRMPRVRISCPVSLLVDGTRQQVTLVDVSQGGAKLATDLLREGDDVTIGIRGLDPHRGTVRWAHDGHAGIAFLAAIPFDKLAKWALERQAEG